MSAEALQRDTALVSQTASGSIDVAVVLGSGLSDAIAANAAFARIPYAALEGIPAATLTGHAGAAFVGTLHEKRVLVFAGRVHLYQGFSAQQVTYSVALAAQCGAKALVLTNAAGGLNPAFAPGDLMLIADHINLTGANPLTGMEFENPFIDMSQAYSARLRSLAREQSSSPVQEGVYVGLAGPSYETPAETRFLRGIGADAVGMSTVLETIAARRRNLEVLGISLITNVAGAPETTHAEVTAIGKATAARLATLLDRVIAKL